ncbi:MAG: flagellar motor protein MotB [Phycisphaerales bacterium]
MPECSLVTSKRSAHIRFSLLASLLGAAALLIGGCSSTQKQDELGRLTAQREQLREDVSRAQMERDRMLAELAQPIPAPPVDEPTTPPRATDPDFGGGTITSRRGGDLVVEVAGDVLFDSGSVTLKSSAKRTLDRIAQTIRGRYAGNIVRVEGYTDRDPIRKSKFESNEELSAKRALAVEKYLVSKGIPGDRIYAAAFGPANPKSTKQQSRRVEIVILGAN